ncbi:MAG: VWA domain-containing protein [Cyanobacteria bacterium SZAS-4]|nr:VWA domain-containing protein [Cyanobacteria bacterium SZAS-4]
MRVPKLVIFLMMLGAAIVSYIVVAIHSEIEMFHMFDQSDKHTETASTAPAGESSEGTADQSTHSETDSPNSTETSSESGDKKDSESTEENSSEDSSDTTSDADTESSSEFLSAVAPESSSASAAVSANVDPTYSKLIAPTIKIKNGMRPRLDVAFCIDTTSSMQGEIDTVKAKVKSMVEKIGQSKQRPIVRVGLVAYRDNADEYVTKVFPFSENINAVVRSISDLAAEGGGDGPEAVDQGLHSAINDLQWDNSKKTAKLLFLIGDAPPHDSNSKFDWKAESQNAVAHGIHINAIGCDTLEGYSENGINIFKQIALRTNGNYEPLSYHQQIVDTKGNAATLITSGGKSYVMKSTDKEAWKTDINTLVAKGDAAPSLQGATNGTIGVQGSDATYVTGVNTAGTVRSDNNLDSVMLQGAQSVMSKVGF